MVLTVFHQTVCLTPLFVDSGELLYDCLSLLQTALRQRLAPQQQADGEEEPADDVGPSTTEADLATGSTRNFDAMVPVEVCTTSKSSPFTALVIFCFISTYSRSSIPVYPDSLLPSAIAQEVDTEDMVGPAVPPADSDAEDGDAWDGRGTGEPDEEQDPYRLPVTSEVALEGAYWSCLVDQADLSAAAVIGRALARSVASAAT